MFPRNAHQAIDGAKQKRTSLTANPLARRLTGAAAIALAALTFTHLAPTAQAAPLEIGLWYDDTGRGAVEISPCGNQLCGHIVWLANPNASSGKPLRDIYNPEPRMRNRPICGIQVLGNLKPQSDGTWGQGWVYDPKVGKSYNVELQLKNKNNLTVYGYAGVKLFGKSIPWTRAPSDLPRCKPGK
ncbi:MAG: DUF2147 domain-containing protein [Alphaproteobacteria bacterium]|nr:DUF2147 domain-containing protein [Alphaproteobacteria bacterium]